jgi:hypothetical protein
LSYKILVPQLHPIADAARKLFAQQFGLAENKFQVETPISKSIDYTPTLKVETRDKYLVIIEVAESIPAGLIGAALLQMKNEGWPAKVYVAIPPGPTPSTFKQDLRFARANGVGLVEVGEALVTYQEPLLLHLTGVRRPVPADYPKPLREAVMASLSTFENGNPKKACSAVTDEIEALTRRLAALARKEGALRAGAPQFKSNSPWANVADILVKHLDTQNPIFRNLNASLLNRVAGLTAHRNDTSHPAKSLANRRSIDAELRTRFEHACDVLRDFSKACPPQCLKP